MTLYKVSADFTITKTIGTFEAESEEEAILKAGNVVREKAEQIGCGCADYVWAEVKGE